MKALQILGFFIFLSVLSCHNSGNNPETNEAATTGNIDEKFLIIKTDQESISAGKIIYDDNCSVCHALDGGGIVGPNFCDDYWIHGNTIADLFPIVQHGVYEKGMIPYKNKLSDEQVQQVLSYILGALNKTMPQAGKAPEGKKY